MSIIKKAVIVCILCFFLIIFGLIFIANFYDTTWNIPLGQRFAQINTGHGSVNIFIPKDDTTWLYFHNLNFPQVIISANTRLENLRSNTTEDNNKKGATGSYEHKSLQTSVPSPKSISPKYIKSKILNLTFTTPDGVEASYYPHVKSDLSEGNEIIEYRTGYLMRILISANYNCEDTTRYSAIEPKTVLLANEIPLIFPNNRMGFRHGGVKLNATKHISSKKACIDVDQEITSNGDEEKIFDQIITSAKP